MATIRKHLVEVYFDTACRRDRPLTAVIESSGETLGLTFYGRSIADKAQAETNAVRMEMEMLPMLKSERRVRQSGRMPHSRGAGGICKDRAPAFRYPMTLMSD